jgi:hypothetical protein
MSASVIAQRVRQEAEAAQRLLPAHDLTQPGPEPMSLDEVARKLAVEYSEALELLGKL